MEKKCDFSLSLIFSSGSLLANRVSLKIIKSTLFYEHTRIHYQGEGLANGNILNFSPTSSTQMIQMTDTW